MYLPYPIGAALLVLEALRPDFRYETYNPIQRYICQKLDLDTPNAEDFALGFRMAKNDGWLKNNEDAKRCREYEIKRFLATEEGKKFESVLKEAMEKFFHNPDPSKDDAFDRIIRAALEYAKKE